MRWLVIGGCSVLLAAVTWQGGSMSEMRRENERLRARIDSAPKEVATQTTVPEPENTVGQLGDHSVEPSQKDKTELVRLRDEVRQLREATAPATARTRAASNQPTTDPQADEISRLGAQAMQGDFHAFEQLAKILADSKEMDMDEKRALLADLQRTFTALGEEAGRGNKKVLQSIWQASRLPELEGFAMDAMGKAAALGNADALQPLLNPDDYSVLRSCAVEGLKPVADAGNIQAIEALAATVADPKQHALWLMAADGLASAASAGNAVAIDSLATLAADTNKNVSRAALQALEIAAAKGQPGAQQALQKLARG